MSPVPTFTLLSDAAWAREPVPPPLIEDFLPAGTLGQLFGPPNAGKTFVALSLSTAVALAPDWLGYRVVTPGRVAYAVGEGHAHFPRRLQALRTNYGLKDHEPSGVLYLREPFTLLNADDVTGVIASVRAELAGEPLQLFTLDPLASFMVGGDENSPRDMGLVQAALRRLRDELAATILVLHHTGWGDLTRERGHSSQRGAADVVYAVKADNGLITLENAKVRDGALARPLQLQLRAVGESCVIALATPDAAGHLTAKQLLAVDALRRIVLDEPVSYTRWRTAALPFMSESTFDEAVPVLVKRGDVAKSGRGRNARYAPATITPTHPDAYPGSHASTLPRHPALTPGAQRTAQPPAQLALTPDHPDTPETPRHPDSGLPDTHPGVLGVPLGTPTPGLPGRTKTPGTEDDPEERYGL